jgi:hypothetical protein
MSWPVGNISLHMEKKGKKKGTTAMVADTIQI